MAVLIELMKQRPRATLVRMFALGVIIAAVVKTISSDIGPVPLLLVTVAIEAAFLLGIVGGITAVTQLVVRRRRTKERRHLARLNGWRCDARDADLPAALGGSDVRVLDASPPVTSQVEPIPASARAHAVVRGEVNGISFTAFDYFLPGAFPLEVTTAWLVRLPRALPRLTSAEVLGSQAGDELVTFTRERLPSWWVDGDRLAATTRTGYHTHRRFGLSARQLALATDPVIWLARFLSSPERADPTATPSRPGGRAPGG